MKGSTKIAPHENVLTASRSNPHYGFILSLVFVGLYLVLVFAQCITAQNSDAINHPIGWLSSVFAGLVVLVLFMIGYGKRFDLYVLITCVAIIGTGIGLATQFSKLNTSGNNNLQTASLCFLIVGWLIGLYCALSLTFGLLTEMNYI